VKHRRFCADHYRFRATAGCAVDKKPSESAYWYGFCEHNQACSLCQVCERVLEIRRDSHSG